MPARLNRRRYREVVAMLKEVISDKKQPAARRLQAGTTLLEVYARHDRTEAERTRRKAAAAVQEPEPVETAAAAPLTHEDALQQAREFLASIGGNTNAD